MTVMPYDTMLKRIRRECLNRTVKASLVFTAGGTALDNVELNETQTSDDLHVDCVSR